MLDRLIGLPVELALTPDQEPAAPAKTTSPTIAANARGRGIRPRLNVRLTWIPQLLGRMNHAGCSVGGRADRLDPGTMLTSKISAQNTSHADAVRPAGAAIKDAAGRL